MRDALVATVPVSLKDEPRLPSTEDDVQNWKCRKMGAPYQSAKESAPLRERESARRWMMNPWKARPVNFEHLRMIFRTICLLFFGGVVFVENPKHEREQPL